MTIAPDLRLRSPHPLFRLELEQAAFNHGFRRPNGDADGWLWFRSDEGVPGEVALASGSGDDGGPWFLAVEHAGVARSLELEFPEATFGPIPAAFTGAFAFAEQAAMRIALSRAFHLARSLPSFPLSAFEDEVRSLGDTEIDRIVRQRIGQGVFRRALLDYWGRCPLTGITEPALLRASHIVAWVDCESDAERLDVFNGLLLSAHWDAAFDIGLISFSDEGEALCSPRLDAIALDVLRAIEVPRIALEDGHRLQLQRHRRKHGFD